VRRRIVRAIALTVAALTVVVATEWPVTGSATVVAGWPTITTMECAFPVG